MFWLKVNIPAHACVLDCFQMPQQTCNWKRTKRRSWYGYHAYACARVYACVCMIERTNNTNCYARAVHCSGASSVHRSDWDGGVLYRFKLRFWLVSKCIRQGVPYSCRRSFFVVIANSSFIGQDAAIVLSPIQKAKHDAAATINTDRVKHDKKQQKVLQQTHRMQGFSF